VKRLRSAYSARVEPDDVEPPAEILVKLFAEVTQYELDSGTARAARVDEHTADAIRGMVGRNPGKRDLRRGSRRQVVIEWHLGRRPLAAGEILSAWLPTERRHLRSWTPGLLCPGCWRGRRGHAGADGTETRQGPADALDDARRKNERPALRPAARCACRPWTGVGL
jgi:hypothetical protein